MKNLSTIFNVVLAGGLILTLGAFGLPGFSVQAGDPLRPTPSGLAACPPLPRSPEGFSNEIERDSSRVERS